jgi:hypothetical protein
MIEYDEEYSLWKLIYEMWGPFIMTDSLFMWESLNLPYTVHILSTQIKYGFWGWSYSNQNLHCLKCVMKKLHYIFLEIAKKKTSGVFSSNEIVMDLVEWMVNLHLKWIDLTLLEKMLLYNTSFWLKEIEFISESDLFLSAIDFIMIVEIVVSRFF